MTDLAVDVVKEEHLPVEETDDSCIFKYIEVVPLDTHTDVSSTSEFASGDGSSEVKQENLTSVKQESDDVCWFSYTQQSHSHKYTHKHTHTHTRLAALCPGLPRLAGIRKVNQSGFC